jgi:hypothetical protein
VSPADRGNTRRDVRTGRQLVLEIEGREAARTDFTVDVTGDANVTAFDRAGADATSREPG